MTGRREGRELLTESEPVSASSPTYAPRATRMGVAAVVIPIAGFSLMNLVVKVVDTPPLVFAFYRLWIGSVVMVVLLVALGRRLSWATVGRAAVSGMLFGANLCFFFSALRLTSIADVLIVAALQPALTLLVAGPMFGERVTRHDVAWTAVSLVGVVLVILGSSGTPVWSWKGDLFAVGALLAWTIYWILSKRVRQDVPALEYMTAVTIVAALTVTPVALLSGQSFHLALPDAGWLILFVAGAQGGHSLLAWSHAQVDVSISSLLILIEPVLSPVAALVFLGEPLPALSIAGVLITVVAVGMVIRRATRETAPEVSPA
jgi:drug/metabolite transporter (DMT)-like permease